MNVTIEVILILLLIVTNGFFALSEMALVAARELRLKSRAEAGARGAGIALQLKQQPDRFFSTVQIGITLIGILIGAASGATIAQRLQDMVAGISFLEPYSGPLGLGVVVLTVTFLTLILGELVPKKLAVGSPERLSMLTAPIMSLLMRLSMPAVYLLSGTTRLVVRLLRIKPSQEPGATEEDIRGMIKEAALAGEVDLAEKFLLERIFRLNDRQVRAIMTDHSKVVWIDMQASPSEILLTVLSHPHSRFPVMRGSDGKIAGAIKAKEYLGACLAGNTPKLQDYLHQPLYVPETMHALGLLEMFRRRHQMHLAVVVDPSGNPKGIVTFNDVLEAIVGHISSSEAVSPEPMAVQREDGSWLLDGLMSFDAVQKLLQAGPTHGHGPKEPQSLADFVLTQMGRIPEMGEFFDWNGYRFEIVDLDGRRIDRILVVALTNS